MEDGGAFELCGCNIPHFHADKAKVASEVSNGSLLRYLSKYI